MERFSEHEPTELQIWGAHAPSHVAIGALADGILKFYRKRTRFKDVAGEGAGHHTRGRVCSPECFAPSLDGDLGPKKGLAGHAAMVLNA